jgi:hypothetical protein
MTQRDIEDDPRLMRSGPGSDENTRQRLLVDHILKERAMESKTGTFIIFAQWRNPGDAPLQTAIFTRDNRAEAEEVAAGFSDAIDGAADLYAIGPCLAHYRGGEIFTGKANAR